MRKDLYDMRKAIDEFYEHEHRFPRSLDELVPKHLRRVPEDPLTRRVDTWVIVRGGQDVVDVRSAAKGKTCEGTPYSEL